MRIMDWSSDVCSSDLGKDLGLHVARPERIFRLKGGDRVGRVGPAYRPCAGLGKADAADLARLDQPGHGGDGEIGRASVREGVCQYVEISVVAVCIKKTAQTKYNV